MSYTALYRKFRPATFDEVKGQDHIVTTLKNQIKADRMGHAYLFCGTRGTGKTSVAKIFAKAVNCENPVDGSPCGECSICKAVASGASMNVIEIDAASNNGVDNIRDIKEEVEYSPTEGRFKVYIIDEVHMLSMGAFNALLKTLEEPPSYVIFILATTEANKIPITILSRCQRYDFKRISIDTISQRLVDLMKEEGVEAEEKALKYVAKAADGSMRDALSLLDQCLAFNMNEALTYDKVLDILGAVDTEVFSRFFRKVMEGNSVELIKMLDDIIIEGRDLGQFVTDFTWYLRNLMLLKSNSDATQILEMSKENMALLSEDAALTDMNGIMRYIRIFAELTGKLRNSTQKRVLVEVALIKLCTPSMENTDDSLKDRVKVLERTLETALAQIKQAALSGNFAAADTSQTTANPQQTQAYEPVKPKLARSEDILAVIKNWNMICNGFELFMKPALSKYAIKANGGGNKLQLIFDNETMYSMLNTPENIEKIKSVIIEKTKLDIDIEIIHAPHGTNIENEYDTLEDVCRMNIEEEDF